MRTTPLLQASQISKSYGNKTTLHDISFHISPGEVVGLLGPNGAGKTTAFYIAVGLIKPDKGTIFFRGSDVTKLSIDARAKLGIGYLAQEPSIFRALSVEDNLLCILETLPISQKEREEKLLLLLSELHLDPLRKIKAGKLSGGERRRLEITRALITQPQLLLLDEPFANVDPMTVSDVKKMIRHLRDKNISILITDHNAREIFSVVDRSYLLYQGEVKAEGSVSDITENEEVKRLYLGHSFSL